MTASSNSPSKSFYDQWLSNPSKDILSGLVVAFAMIPEAISFSGFANVDPQVGLYGAFCLAITIAIVGGRMGMITSVTGSTALLMTGLVKTGITEGTDLGLSYEMARLHGFYYLIAAGILTGIFQILWGYLRLAYQMRFVPSGVLSGFVNALALLIFTAQFSQMGLGGYGSGKMPTGIQIPIVWLLIIFGLLIIYGLPKITKVIPSQLVAILILTIISINFFPNIPTVNDLASGGGEVIKNTTDSLGIRISSGLPNGLPSFTLPFGDISYGKIPFNLKTFGMILPTSLAISLVGLMETFLTQDILDDMTDSNSNKNKEARGQGLANIVSSLFGGMAGCALVGQSVMNTENGGRTRLSTFSSGISLLIIVLLCKPWLKQIPMAALVAVMISIAISTADINGLKNITKIPKSDTAVMIMTFAVTMLTTPHNLALGVIAGVALAGILFSRKVAKVIKVKSIEVTDQEIIYEVTGQLFFVSKIYFIQGFDLHKHHKKIIIDMSNAHIWDQSGVGALNQIIRKLSLGGSDVSIKGLNHESLDLFERLSGMESSH